MDGVTAPFTFTLIAGGRSNLTFEVVDGAGRRLVLRRPPLSHVLASAHDVAREHRLMTALRPTPVPVPVTLGLCLDEAVNGRPFFVMDFVEGHVLRTQEQTERILDEAGRRRVADDLVDVLAAIHAQDVAAIGLADLARGSGYIGRQLKRWHGQFQQSQAQEREAGVHRTVPLVDEVHDLLQARVPEQRETALVHGDYRLDNTIVGPDGRIRAVLDWELCTLGDPLADLGTLLMYWSDGTSADALTGRPSTRLPGFPTRVQLAERYEASSGRALTDLGFYLAFANWRLACIMEGVYARYAAGAMGADGASADMLGQQVQRRAEAALAALS